jgi:hypothetical protein
MRKKIRMATFNVRNGRQGNLESALRTLKMMNIDSGILEETKIANAFYTRKAFGYEAIATKAISMFQGGIALVYRPSEFWTIEAVRVYSPNVISYQLVTGNRRFACVGAYIPPADTTPLEPITTAVEEMPTRLPLILMGGLNADIERPRDNRATEVAFLAASFGLEDLLRHFRQRRRFTRGITWRMRRGQGLITSRCDNILCSGRRILENIAIREPRNYSLDHYLIGSIASASLLLGVGNAIHYIRPRWGPKTREESLFNDIKSFITPDPKREREWKSWIADNTWRLI